MRMSDAGEPSPFSDAAPDRTGWAWLLLGFGALGALVPGAWHGYQDSAWIAALGGAAGLMAAGVWGVAWQQHRLRDALDTARRHARVLQLMLDHMPGGMAAWPAEPNDSVGPVTSNGYRMVMADETLPERFTVAASAWMALRWHGTAFDLEIAEASDRVFGIVGRRVPRPGDGSDMIPVIDVVHVEDRTGRARLRRRLAEERQVRGSVVSALPLPIWLRGADGCINACNPACADALETEVGAVVRDRMDFASGPSGWPAARQFALRAAQTGMALTENRRLMVDNRRRIYRVTEVPLDSTPMSLFGCAVDITNEEALRGELDRLRSAQSLILEQLGSAIAIFGADKRLLFYNQAYVRLFRLSEAALAGRPTYSAVLEEMRMRSRLPEHADFPLFKREQLALFQKLIDPQEDLLHLPDGTTLRQLILPYPLGGLMFVLEDVSSALALESSYNTLIAVQRETLDHLAEGISVFGSDGRLKLSNPAYAAIWNLEPGDLDGEPHITRLLDRVKDFFDYGHDWRGFRRDMVTGTLERASRSGRIQRVDGSVIAFTNVPLPDGAVLSTFLDVSDSVRVEKALEAANAALEAADAIKIGILANVSYRLRTPLTTLLGYGEMLAQGQFGVLAQAQAGAVGTMLAAGAEMLQLINDIVTLAMLEAGSLSLDRRLIRVDSLLTGALTEMHDWSQRVGVPMGLVAEGDLGAVCGDEVRLRQVVSHLVGVGLRYPPPARLLVLRGRRVDDRVLISTTAGAGCRVEAGAAMDTVTAQPLPGVGLGMLRSLVDRQGGHFELGTPCDGAVTLGFRLPCVDSADPPPPPDAA